MDQFGVQSARLRRFDYNAMKSGFSMPTGSGLLLKT
jgi:hypothetical protein